MLDGQNLFSLEFPTESNDRVEIFNLGVSDAKHPMKAEVLFNGNLLQMQVDTGSAVSVISEECCNKLRMEDKLSPSLIALRQYSGQLIHPIGKLDVEIKFGKKSENIVVHVVRGGGPPLLGRDYSKNRRYLCSVKRRTAFYKD